MVISKLVPVAFTQPGKRAYFRADDVRLYLKELAERREREIITLELVKEYMGQECSLRAYPRLNRVLADLREEKKALELV